jgi:hypothetical protein
MTVKDFLLWSTGYFGDYPEGQQADIWAYLKTLAPHYLDALKVVLLKTYPSRFGKPPDVAAFEAAIDGALNIHEKNIDPRYYLPQPPQDEDDSDLVTLDWSEIFRKKTMRHD